MHTFWQDLRYGARMLLKRPGFTLAAVITLALGIGANTAIFSVVNAVLLRPLPYPESDRLVMVSTKETDGVLGNTGYTTFVDWRERSNAFEHLAVIRRGGGTLTGLGEPEVIEGLRVSANYFRLLGVSPALGRDFQFEEDRPSTRFVVIISQSLWQRRFNSDPNILGKPLVLSDRAFTIVGVMPPNFKDLLAANFYEPADIWAPVGYDLIQSFACRTCQHLKTVGRLKPDVSLERAHNELKTIMEVMSREHPQTYATAAISVARLQDQFVGAIRPALYLLLVAVGLVLLIACANIANLLLARGSERARELAIRATLGAGRWRLVRQLLIESLLLSVIGAGIGLLLAVWGTETLIGISPAQILQLQPVNVDAWVLAFTLLMSLLTCLLFGLAPAWQAARQDVQLALKEGARGSSSKRQRRLRESFVVAQMIFALVLLVGAGLLIRSFVRVLDSTPGFESRNLLTMQVPATGAKYDEARQIIAFYTASLERIRALPGVEGAGIVSNLPFGGNKDTSAFHVEEKPLPNPAEAPSAERFGISTDYLRAMGIPLLRGRWFTEHDTADTPLVALINNTAAQRIWPNEDPIGKRIRLGGIDGPLRTIVGIVGDVHHYGLEIPPDLQAYVPQAQWTGSYMQLVVRTSGDPGALAAPVREAIRAVDADIPVYEINTMKQLISASVAQRRFTLLLIGIFAMVALLMAAVGIYGVMSYSVTQRTQEIGIRLALGAQPKDVFRMIVGQGMTLALLGIAFGLVGAFGLTRLMASMLFGVEPTDPLTFAGIAVLLTTVSLIACYVPGRRATKVDPLVSLRYE
ncbi:MAG TPA: ABC transporter permease [Pyrinomonadaceae bacterium]|nr:ABC transporter permease [Pyrinomonadaceae bacterium]